jgi:membrane-associated protease RseP (regulator of RpoE activity)
LQDGDVITAINGHKILDWEDLTNAVESLNPGETIKVAYTRDGKSREGSKPIKSYAETKKCSDCDCDDMDEITINVNPKIKLREPSRWGLGNVDENDDKPRLDVSNSNINLEDLPVSDAGTLKEKGVNVPSSNTLTVERLSMSPNPNRGMFNLSFNLPTSGETTVRVFNSNGRAIYEYELGNFSGSFEDEVDISQNGAGNYFLYVMQGDKVFTKKIVLTGK